MRTAGVSVPDVVREIITRNRSIYECMKMDVINYTALAVKIQPDVEKAIGNPANLNTIVVAIKRYADSEFFRLGDSFRILTEDSDRVRRMFQSLPKENEYNAGLAKIKVSVPPNHSRSDVMAFVTEILHFNGIDMADALFTQDGLVIVLKEEDAPRAYEKLRAQISR